MKNCRFRQSHAVEKQHGGHRAGGTGNVRSALAKFKNQTFTNLSKTLRPGAFLRAPRARGVISLGPGKPLVSSSSYDQCVEYDDGVVVAVGPVCREPAGLGS